MSSRLIFSDMRVRGHTVTAALQEHAVTSFLELLVRIPSAGRAFNVILKMSGIPAPAISKTSDRLIQKLRKAGLIERQNLATGQVWALRGPCTEPVRLGMSVDAQRHTPQPIAAHSPQPDALAA